MQGDVFSLNCCHNQILNHSFSQTKGFREVLQPINTHTKMSLSYPTNLSSPRTFSKINCSNIIQMINYKLILKLGIPVFQTSLHYLLHCDFVIWLDPARKPLGVSRPSSPHSASHSELFLLNPLFLRFGDFGVMRL